MSNALEIDGQILYPIKDAADEVSYSRDYVTRLAREHKIRATYIGRQWFVDIDSLKNYAEASTMEQEIRKKQLSEERKREQQLHAAAEQKNVEQHKRASSAPRRAAVVASLVLCFGVLTGLATEQLISFDTTPSAPQVATTQSVPQVQVMPTAQPVLVAEVEMDSPAEPVQIEPPSQSIEAITDMRNGVLLYPATATTTPADLFSDDVFVEERSDGSKWIYARAVNGRGIGEPIPFVAVPLAADDIE